MSSQASMVMGALVTSFTRPELKDHAAHGLADNASDWLCTWCLNRVANEKDRFRYGGREEFVFSNPDGLQFAIITFSQTLTCRSSGVPTLEHTWFPGHAWFYCHCDGCGQHLGWYYKGQFEFAGLIKDRLVRALTIRN